MHWIFGHKDTFLFQTKRNIQKDDLTLLSLVRKSWMSYKNSSIDCISTAEVRWNQNDYLNQTLALVAGVELEKIKSCLRRLN